MKKNIIMIITMTIKMKILFNVVRQLYSMPQFLRTNFKEVNYNERTLLP